LNKNEFLEIIRTNVKREGTEELLSYLQKTDFFSCPASTKFHCDYEGGLCEHSLSVYKRLKRMVAAEEKVEASEETIAICGLLHDVCKANYYKVQMRNTKQNGAWVEQPFYTVDDSLPFGHGEKSVYIINGFMRLTREEAMAINWHMGFTDARAQVGYALSEAFRKFPLATLMHAADFLSTYIDENSAI
jgi:hypothetical protein